MPNGAKSCLMKNEASVPHHALGHRNLSQSSLSGFKAMGTFMYIGFSGFDLKFAISPHELGKKERNEQNGARSQIWKHVSLRMYV